MSKQVENAAPVISGPITKELAGIRCGALAALLTSIRARITRRRIAFKTGASVPMENESWEIDIEDYVRETSPYCASDDVEYYSSFVLP